MEEKILTQEIVKELGLDKVSVITADMLDGYTSIGNYAFYYCTGLTSMTIPNSVTSIGVGAFDGCTGLTSVHISDIAAWCAISFGDNPLHYAHNLYLNGELVTNLVIPNSVTSIRSSAFEECSRLTSVMIGNSVTSIGDSAFFGCTGLTSVNILSGVTSIGSSAFEGCSRLTSVTIGNSVTSIGNYAFLNCTGLTSVTIPNSVTSIGNSAFFDCTGLTSVTIGDKTYKKQTVTNGKCKAYKAFKSDMTCRGFQYKEGETYKSDCEPKLCECGFHACLSLADVFNYYHGELGKDVVVHEVELEDVSYERNDDSKVVAKKIKIGKRIL